jgi:hypothetical protein
MDPSVERRRDRLPASASILLRLRRRSGEPSPVFDLGAGSVGIGVGLGTTTGLGIVSGISIQMAILNAPAMECDRVNLRRSASV